MARGRLKSPTCPSCLALQPVSFHIPSHTPSPADPIASSSHPQLRPTGAPAPNPHPTTSLHLTQLHPPPFPAAPHHIDSALQPWQQVSNRQLVSTRQLVTTLLRQGAFSVDVGSRTGLSILADVASTECIAGRAKQVRRSIVACRIVDAARIGGRLAGLTSSMWQRFSRQRFSLAIALTSTLRYRCTSPGGATIVEGDFAREPTRRAAHRDARRQWLLLLPRPGTQARDPDQ